MDFTELCRETARLADVTGWSTLVVAGATGEHQHVVRWTRNAWLALQQMHEWSFLRADLSFVTVADQAAYTEATMQAVDKPIRYIDRESVRVQLESLGSVDQQFMTEWDWGEWYNTFGYGPQVSGRPMIFSIRPDDQAMVLGSIPDAVYRITGKYWRQAQSLTLGTDVPIIKDELHMLIPYQALLSYANREAAAEAKTEAVERREEMLPLMRRLYLPAVHGGGPLA